MALNIVTQPTKEPVTLDRAKLHLRVDIDDDDPLIAGYIMAARQWAEAFTRRALVTQVLALTLDAFPAGAELRLPRPPLQGVTQIQYTDSDGTPAVFDAASYFVDTKSEPGRVVLQDGESWPSVTLQIVNGVEVTFTAGYGSPESVPEHYKQAILLVVGHWYENREQVATTGAVPQEIPIGARNLLWIDRNF